MEDHPTTAYGKILKHFIKKYPKVAIIGLTGTPYRGVESIVGPFWEYEVEPKVGRQFLVSNGYIVPTIFGFGHDDVQYDLSEFNKLNEFGTDDYTASELEQMANKMDVSTTHKIMLEVMELTKSRNAVLITCASLKHCEEAAQVLPKNSYGIVTGATDKILRAKILEDTFNGKLKYVFQIGCLTTGINIPLFDTSIILRKIGSLTLLTQLLGRGMRLLKDFQVEQGITKNDHLVLDYTDTMASMQSMFDDPLLEQAVLDKSKKKNEETRTCPVCEFENSIHARRCVNGIVDVRCDHFFSYNECAVCHTKNDKSARVCRNSECNKVLVDPNANLKGKHYTEADWKEVISIKLIACKKGGILVVFDLEY